MKDSYDKLPERIQANLPVYISKRIEDFDLLAKLDFENDLQEIRDILHKIRGSAKTYGLNILDEFILNMRKSIEDQQFDQFHTYRQEAQRYILNLAFVHPIK